MHENSGNGLVMHLAALRLAAGGICRLVRGRAGVVQPPLQVRHQGLALAVAAQQLLCLLIVDSHGILMSNGLRRLPLASRTKREALFGALSNSKGRQVLESKHQHEQLLLVQALNGVQTWTHLLPRFCLLLQEPVAPLALELGISLQ